MKKNDLFMEVVLASGKREKGHQRKNFIRQQKREVE